LTRSTPKSPVGTSLFSKVKDVVFLVGGIVGMVYEAGFVEEPRTILIGAYLLALGLPVFNGVDRLFQRGPGGTPPSDEESS
jgi:hypothetical protein